MKTTRSFISILALAIAGLGLSACSGQSPEAIVKNANVQVSNQSGETFVKLTTEVSTQNLIFSAAVLPIYDRKDPLRLLGQVDLVTDITTQKSYMTVTINTGTLFTVPMPDYSSTLPNGTVLPFTGVDLSKVMVFDVGLGGSKLYVYHEMGTNKTIIGAAINVDSLGVGSTANVFALFDYNNVKGLAGLYFGQQPQTSGFGVFADITNFLTSTKSATLAKKAAKFTPMKASSENQTKIMYKLYELSTSNKPITVK